MEGKTSKRDSGHHENEALRKSAMHGDFDPLDGGKSNTAAGRLGGTSAEEANRNATLAEREHASGLGSKTAAGGLAGSGLSERERTSGLSGKTAGVGAGAGAAGLAAGQSHGNVRGVEESGRSHLSSDKHDRHSSSSSGTSGTALEKKPSLLDRINPMKDADGDGKKGFMK